MIPKVEERILRLLLSINRDQMQTDLLNHKMRTAKFLKGKKQIRPLTIVNGDNLMFRKWKIKSRGDWRPQIYKVWSQYGYNIRRKRN